MAQGELEVPEVQLADPTGGMPAQVAPNVNLNPAQAAIIDRVRRMGGGIRRPQLERSALMLSRPQAQ